MNLKPADNNLYLLIQTARRHDPARLPLLLATRRAVLIHPVIGALTFIPLSVLRRSDSLYPSVGSKPAK